MRLFIGLPFDADARRAFAAVRDRLQARSAGGKFTSFDNFHLTLAFLGEVEEEDLPAVKAALRSAPVPPMALTFDRLSFFSGGIWHLAPAFCAPLFQAQLRLILSLEREGFPPEDRPYIPHLTLGRKISPLPGQDPAEALSAPIPARSGPGILFHSHRVEGVLTYTPIFTP